MKRKRKLTVVLMMLMLLLVPATAALAGGWAVITLDALPGQIRAGETLRLGFTVRQHGVRPLNDVTPMLSAVNRDTGETVTATAEQVGAIGHFEVAVRFPDAGVWEWQIAAPPFPQQSRFEPLTVLSAAPAGETEVPPPAVGNVRATLRWSGVVILGLAALLALLRPWREEVTVPGSTV